MESGFNDHEMYWNETNRLLEIKKLMFVVGLRNELDSMENLNTVNGNLVLMAQRIMILHSELS